MNRILCVLALGTLGLVGQGVAKGILAMPSRPGLASAEAPEPHSRLGPTGGIPIAGEQP